MSKWIESEKIILRTYRLNDWREIIKYMSEPEVWRYLDEVPFDEKTARQFIGYNVEQQTIRDGFADHIPIVLKPNLGIIGHLFLQKVYRLGPVMEAGVMIDPKHQGKGYGTEALRNLIKYAFEEMNVHRIEASCDARNASAVKMLEKAGMSREGICKESMLVGGKWEDEYLYAVLKAQCYTDAEI